MTILKNLVAASAMVLMLGAMSVTAFAASDYKTPAEAVAGLTGRTVESVISERQETGKTYGTIAAEAGKLDEYKAESLEMKEENLSAQVTAGTLTQEEADAILKAIKENQAVCDGSGSARIGQGAGARFGSNGTGLGNGGAGCGMGAGRGQGRGRGLGLRDGSCYIAAN